MKEYTVRHGQNIYDISLMLYGSIEGIFDLLANNDGIDINSQIPVGTVLKYDDDFEVNSQIKNWLTNNKIVVANGEPQFMVSGIDLGNLRIVVDQSGPTSVIGVRLSSGVMYIDWGDGSKIDIVTGTSDYVFDHPYLEDGRHTIRIYGNFALRNLDFTEIGGIYYAVSNCRVTGTFKESTNRADLRTLFR